MFKFVRPDLYFHWGIFPRPKIKRIPVNDAPEFMQGLRIAFVSDVHLRPRVSDARLSALMETIQSMNADLILLGGDYAETPDDCRRFFRFLSEIRPKHGIYGVFGNNDFICRGDLKEIMAESSVKLLLNEGDVIALPGGG